MFRKIRTYRNLFMTSLDFRGAKKNDGKLQTSDWVQENINEDLRYWLNELGGLAGVW